MAFVFDAVREGTPVGDGTLTVPGSNASCIHVNETVAGIVADTAQFQIKAGFAQLARIDSGQANVDGASLDVIAGFGHAGPLFAQSVIGAGGPVTGKDVKGSTTASQLTVYGIEQVHQLGVHGFDVAGVVIP